MRWLLLVLLMFLLIAPASAQSPYEKYGGDTLFNRTVFNWAADYYADSAIRDNPMTRKGKVSDSTISSHHYYKDKTADFYFLFLVIFGLGLIRVSNPRYFSSLLRSFTNPIRSNRALVGQLQTAETPNFLMNVFFSFSLGAYLYYLIISAYPKPPGLSPWLLILLLIVGVSGIYLVKYFVIRITGWAFRVDALTEQYLFNVFLVNKILGIVLLPFIILLAFCSGPWVQSVATLSVIVFGVMLLNRYLRSWQVFKSFFQYSRFHFFTYLCASELLPMAVLIKLVVKGYY